MVIPANVSHIGNWAFYGCSSMKTITIHNKDCVIINDTSALSVVVPYKGAITIPKTIKIIGHENSTAKSYANEYGNAFGGI